MAEREPPPFIVKDILYAGSAAALVSAANVGKTFIALDMAFHVAAGIPWHGYQTQRTPVIYVLAEGVGGMATRVKAWRISRDVPQGVAVGVWFWDKDVQLANFPSRQAFAAELAKVESEAGMPPGLIIVDTLARCFVGFDENAAQDMGRFVEGIDMLRASGAAVLVLHHEGHLKGRERGSTALRGAVDTMLHLANGEGGCLVLSCQKQRETEPFDTQYLMLRTVDLPGGKTSCIVEDAPASSIPVSGKWQEAVDVLAKYPDGSTAIEWRKAVPWLAERTFFRMKKEVLNRGLVHERDGKFYHPMFRKEPS